MRKIYLNLAPLIIAISLFCGCVYPTAHENFKSNLRLYIGRDINSVQAYSEEDLRVSVLPNGNSEYRYTIQYKYGRHGPCTKIFEVDSKTHKIIRADFEGSENDCIIPI